VQTWYPTGGVYSAGNAPWHTLTPAIRAEEAGELAFSSVKAAQLGVEWTNFIGGASLDILENWMDQSTTEHYIPYLPTMGGYVTQDEADSRWSALQVWYAGQHHFWLGTGPFYLQEVSYDPKSLTLAHFDAYPDAAGRWDAFAPPAQPVMMINHSSGAPGSYFNVTGTGFPPDSLATIVANDHILDQLPVDSSGVISFTLNTNLAAPGEYHLRVSVNPSAGVLFTLDEAQPVLPREGELPIIALPGGLVLRPVLLPLIARNYSQGLLYFDDFSNPNSGWYIGTRDNASYSYQDGEYEISVGIPNYGGGGWPPINSILGNFSVETDIRLVEGDTTRYGLILWSPASEGWWFFMVSPNTQSYELWRYDDVNWTLINNGTSTYINQGGVINHLKLEYTGLEVALFINGQFLLSAPTIVFTSTVPAFEVWSSVTPAIVHFDNFEVKRLAGNLTWGLTTNYRVVLTIPISFPEVNRP
jgi:hypothetical protein